MSGKGHYRFETLAIHGGQTPDPGTLARGVPVSRSTSFVFKSAKHAADLFALREQGNIYSRLGNPTVAVLEDRITLLEGGAASVATASGTSAIHYAIITLAGQGDEIVSANNLYGGTYTLFDTIFPQFGITTTFVNPTRPEEFKKAITGRTKAVYIETIGNPGLDFTDVEEIARIAHEAEIPLIVDATFTTPYLLRTIEHGADIVVNSLTKWVGGHGAAIGGMVTDSGKFNWKGNRKFPLLNDPDPNYHGLRWTRDLSPELTPAAYAMRCRNVPLRNLGACLSPDNAWIFLQGVETLPFRMDRHVENAAKVAGHLKNHPKVAWVRFPGLKDDPAHAVASRYLKKGFGGKGAVSFPNFAFWKVWVDFTIRGRMPVTGSLPYEWHDSPNVHLFTYRDFCDWAETAGVVMSEVFVLSEGRVERYRHGDDLRGEEMLVFVEKHV